VISDWREPGPRFEWRESTPIPGAARLYNCILLNHPDTGWHVHGVGSPSVGSYFDLADEGCTQPEGKTISANAYIVRVDGVGSTHTEPLGGRMCVTASEAREWIETTVRARIGWVM
jgi:hypothetical protein